MTTTTLAAEQDVTRRDLLQLPPTIDVETAARALGIGRTTAYALAKANDFPCKLIKAGRSYRVITADLFRVLHITSNTGEGAGSSHPTPSDEYAPHHQR